MHYFWIQEVSVSRDHLTSATKEFEEIHKDLETDLHHALRQFVIILIEVFSVEIESFCEIGYCQEVFFRYKYM